MTPRDYQDTHPTGPEDWFADDVDVDDEFDIMPWEEDGE